MSSLWLVAAAIAGVTTASLQGSSSSYEGDGGPSSWSNTFPTCGDKEQSPIDLLGTCTYQPFPTFSGGIVGEVPTYTNLMLQNNGNTVSLTVPYIITVTGGGLSSTYSLDSVHFHWGNSSDRGSEHTVGGKRFPMEIHMVTYKTSYASLSEALNNNDRQAVAILGIFVEVKASSSVSSTVDSIVQSLTYIAKPGSTTSVSLSLTGLAQTFRTILTNSPFYRYLGSLTTPSCNQEVVWTVFGDTLAVSESQLNAFRRLTFPTGMPMVNNYRPTQSINGRTVYCSSVDLMQATADGATINGNGLGLNHLALTVAILMHSTNK